MDIQKSIREPLLLSIRCTLKTEYPPSEEIRSQGSIAKKPASSGRACQESGNAAENLGRNEYGAWHMKTPMKTIFENGILLPTQRKLEGGRVSHHVKFAALKQRKNSNNQEVFI